MEYRRDHRWRARRNRIVVSSRLFSEQYVEKSSTFLIPGWCKEVVLYRCDSQDIGTRIKQARKYYQKKIILPYYPDYPYIL